MRASDKTFIGIRSLNECDFISTGKTINRGSKSQRAHTWSNKHTKYHANIEYKTETVMYRSKANTCWQGNY